MSTKKYDEEGSNAKVAVENYNKDKKTVFLIGDSIRMGYCGYVKEQLSDIANVYYPEDNCRFAQNILVSLGWWADLVPDREKVDIVHWNCGHWDIARWNNDPDSLNTIEEYCALLERIHKAINRLFPNATVHFATTTPMQPGAVNVKNQRTTAEIIEYNKAAVDAMNRLGVETDDLFAVAKDLPADYYTDYCHYCEDGFRLLGTKVSEYIRKRF